VYKVLKIPLGKRSAVYYKSKLEDKDLQLKEEILKLQHSSNIYSFYGAKRISDHFRVLGTASTAILPGTKLRVNHKRIARVMAKFDIRARFRRKKERAGDRARDRNLPDTQRPNLLKVLQQTSKIKTIPLFDLQGNPDLKLLQTTVQNNSHPTTQTQTPQIQITQIRTTNTSANGIYRPNQVWSKDFTYLQYLGKFIYIATLKDCFTKEIVGVNISDNHNQQLVTEAFNSAVLKYTQPEIIHSDQGREYRAQNYLQKIQSLGIQVSMSAKGHPWENGFQESYYNYFKLELGNPDRFQSKGELVEAIYIQIHQYNNSRIHTSIRTTPSLKRKDWQQQNMT
jgi:transposase InsO family protein